MNIEKIIAELREERGLPRWFRGEWYSGPKSITPEVPVQGDPPALAQLTKKRTLHRNVTLIKGRKWPPTAAHPSDLSVSILRRVDGRRG